MVTVSVHIHSENPDAVHVIQPRLAVAVVGFIGYSLTVAMSASKAV